MKKSFLNLYLQQKTLKTNIKPFIAKLLIILLFLQPALLQGCKEKEPQKFTSYSFDYFDTVAVITGYEYSKEEFDKTAQEIHATFIELNNLFDIYNYHDDLNNIKTINKLVDGVHQEVTVDSRLIEFLEYCKDIYTLTNGKTNIAMGSVLRLWHTKREWGTRHPEEAALPDQQALIDASKHCNIDDLIIDRENSTVFLADPEMYLDVGAIGKGYAIEYVAQLLENAGKTGYCLNVGGNIRPIGPKGNGDLWGVGLENPIDPTEEDPYLEIIDFTDMAFATSGSYQRYYTVDGINYHHIINPDTLYPENMWISVSILSPDAGLADSLSTALFNMTLEEGRALIDSLPDTEAVWLTPDKKLYSSEGFKTFIRTE